MNKPKHSKPRKPLTLDEKLKHLKEQEGFIACYITDDKNAVYYVEHNISNGDMIVALEVAKAKILNKVIAKC